MDEQQTKQRGAGRLLWLFVILAIVVLWWYFRRDADPHAVAQAEADTAAAAAATDPDEILVDLVDDATPDAIEHALGIKLVLVDDSGEAARTKLYHAHVDPARRDAILAELARRSDVEIAEPEATVMLSPAEQEVRVPAAAEPGEDGFPNDPLYKHQWHLDQIGMPEAWKLADGNGVIVAVLDTGVAYEDYSKFHELPDLKGVEFVKPYDFVGNTTHADDDHGHGSHVTGTIAQVTNNGIGVAGVARNVRIMPLKVLSGSGSGSVGGIADAIRYAADNGAKVINMSLGGPFPSKVLKKAVAYAHDKGVTVVCAAGNEGRGRVGYPAAYPGAIAVAATQLDEATTFYSNYGKDIDIAAPGGNTREDRNGDGIPDGVLQNTIAIGDPSKDDYFAYMGTSMASPHVAGVAALVIGEGITDPDRVEQVLKESARRPHGQTYTADRYGAGIVDAPAAVKKARSEGGGLQLALGFLMAGAVAASARRRGLGVKLGWSYLGGVVLGASGLFFLPYLAPGLSSAPVMYTLTHGLPSWDLSLLGPAGHGNAVFFSALIPLALLAVGYGVRRLRPVLAGLAIGVAAHLAFFAAVPLTAVHVPAVLGIGTLWLAFNALVCLGLAR
ncbi:MAG TPA: S8 family serine peptidase, partial [Kofleriaceae bacterium]|nr:S8 family serine peptidase [Kofleriaceae bacterium]